MVRLTRWFQGRKDDGTAVSDDEPRASPPAATRAEALIAEGNLLEDRGDFEAALAHYRQASEVAPDLARAHVNIGNALQQLGRTAEAIDAYKAALHLAPDDPGAHYNLGGAFMRLEELDAAERELREALRLRPGMTDARIVLSDALERRGLLVEAEAELREAASQDPRSPMPAYNLAALLYKQGRLEESGTCYRTALSIAPEFAEAHNGLGMVLQAQGRMDEALASYRNAISLKPDLAEAFNNAGLVLQARGSVDEAADSFDRAVSLQPNAAVAHTNLGNALTQLGQFDAALNSYQRALELHEAAESKANFVRCIMNCTFVNVDEGVRRLVARALSEPWGWKSELANASIRLIKSDPIIGACIDRASSAWPKRLTGRELFGPSGVAVLAKDAVLRAVLENVPVCDVALERCLTAARKIVLDTAVESEPGEDPTNDILPFCCTLARQCFINEYVFSSSDDEQACAAALRDKLAAALQSGQPVHALWIGAVAAYFPLLSVPATDALLHRSGPESLEALLVQQIAEPVEERRHRAAIPVLTEIEAGVSSAVRQQYEENPFPRWVRLPPPAKALPFDVYLRQLLPLASFRPLGKGGDLDVLIAGCGTGSEPIMAAQQFADATVLAVDLSLSSLAYAKRKTAEIGLNNIEYAQADITRLGSIGRTFDVISSMGVLHHLEDPIAGLRVLLSLLRPGGFMRLGLYSDSARQAIASGRQFIAERGYASTVEGIRRCRQDLLGMGPHFAKLTAWGDFFTTSECRDLLFHVQEHRFTLPQVKTALRDTGLDFIGFILAHDVARAYAERFPDDKAQANLDHWREFEENSPDTFAAMYNFWVQKASIT
jgi:tetratricopeptide (TPR) repeat protein/SAM-dependent methyltransferase